MRQTTKITKVLNHLLKGKTITQLEAISLFSAYRLASIVHDLRRDGHLITTVIKRDANGTPYAVYKLTPRKYRQAA